MTSGRVIDLIAIREEISHLESTLRESEKPIDYFWQTAMYLREKESAAKEHLEWLKQQQKEQEELRARHARRPIPPELMDRILSYIPSFNMLEWDGRPTVYVEGLLPHAVYYPSLLLPYYQKPFSTKWTLRNIAKQRMKRTVLDEISLKQHIRLRAEVHSDNATSEILSDLRPLMSHPHQWKRLDIFVRRFIQYDFFDLFKPCLPHLEELNISSLWVTATRSVQCAPAASHLKTAKLRINAFLTSFETGILNSISSLTLGRIRANQWFKKDVFRKALIRLPSMLSQLPCLEELVIWTFLCDRDDLEGLPRVNSTSLRSLSVCGISDPDISLAFLNLFVDCRIDHITIKANIIQEAGELFSDARYVCISVSFKTVTRDLGLISIFNLYQGYVPGALYERPQNGSFPFPKMEVMKLRDIEIRDASEGDVLQLQSNILQTVRVRSDDPATRRISQLRIPRKVVTNACFGKELERYVPSLILG